LNAGHRWEALLLALNQQTYPFRCKVVVDSGSSDHTVIHALTAGFDVVFIETHEFDHGGTRQQAIARYPQADIYLFLTQDALPGDSETIARLVRAFDDPKVGVAYGRQLPNLNASIPEAHARLFNYPPDSHTRQLDDVKQYGIKTIFCSNSFAAYRRRAFEAVGGFPRGTIMGEDTIVAGNILLKGWKIAYVADACVYHSHNYSIRQEFERYFDIGVFHRSNPWIFTTFGRAAREGLKYAASELTYTVRRNPLLLPLTCCSFFAKWMGYQLGLRYKRLPIHLRKKFSMYKRYWDKE